MKSSFKGKKNNFNTGPCKLIVKLIRNMSPFIKACRPSCS